MNNYEQSAISISLPEGLYDIVYFYSLNDLQNYCKCFPIYDYDGNYYFLKEQGTAANLYEEQFRQSLYFYNYTVLDDNWTSEQLGNPIVSQNLANNTFVELSRTEIPIERDQDPNIIFDLPIFLFTENFFTQDILNKQAILHMWNITPIY